MEIARVAAERDAALGGGRTRGGRARRGAAGRRARGRRARRASRPTVASRRSRPSATPRSRRPRRSASGASGRSASCARRSPRPPRRPRPRATGTAPRTSGGGELAQEQDEAARLRLELEQERPGDAAPRRDRGARADGPAARRDAAEAPLARALEDGGRRAARRELGRAGAAARAAISRGRGRGPPAPRAGAAPSGAPGARPAGPRRHADPAARRGGTADRAARPLDGRRGRAARRHRRGPGRPRPAGRSRRQFFEPAARRRGAERGAERRTRAGRWGRARSPPSRRCANGWRAARSAATATSTRRRSRRRSGRGRVRSAAPRRRARGREASVHGAAPGAGDVGRADRRGGARRGAAARLHPAREPLCMRRRRRPPRSSPPSLAALTSPPPRSPLPWALAFDPWAWMLWGREVLRLGLDTAGGPAWKPLPVRRHHAARARPGAAPPRCGSSWPAPAACSRWRARRRWPAGWPGRVAAAVAAGAMALSDWWFFNTALGNSEGLLAAAALWAVVAHLAGRTRVGARARRSPPRCCARRRGRSSASTRSGCGAAGASACPCCSRRSRRSRCCGSGRTCSARAARWARRRRRAARRARRAPSTPTCPGLEVLADFADLLTPPVLVAAVAGAVVGGRTARLAGGRRRPAGSLLVAVMTQAGYAGNPRYNVAAAAVGCVLAGVGVAAAGRAPDTAGASRCSRAVAVFTAGDLRDQAAELGERADRRTDLDALVGARGRGAGDPALRAGARQPADEGDGRLAPRRAAGRSGRPAARARGRLPGAAGLRRRAARAARSRPASSPPPALATGRCGSACAVRPAARSKRIVIRSKPSPRSRPSSIDRVLRSAVAQQRRGRPPRPRAAWSRRARRAACWSAPPSSETASPMRSSTPRSRS